MGLFGGHEPSKKDVPADAPQWSKRKYQLDAAKNFFDLIDKGGQKSPLFRMATGTGKTRTMTMGIIARWLRERRGPVLWIAHLNTLITQTRREMSSMLGEYIGLEQGDRTWESERVCVASAASLYRGSRMRRLAPRPTLVVTDEAHHYVSEENHDVLSKFERCIVTGLTATPRRMDGIPMGRRFDSVAIQYPMREAIADGYLCPVVIDVARIPDLNYDSVKRKDLTADAAGEVQKVVINSIVREALRRVEDRRTVHFWPTVEVAHLAAKIMNEIRPDCAMAIDGTKMDPETKQARIEMFKASKFQHMNNVGVLSEGYDDPGIQAVCLEAPTESAATHEQNIGRGTRNLCRVDDYDNANDRRAAIAASVKPNLLVVDFVGNSTKHRLISAMDILAGDDVDEETLKRAKEIGEQTRMTADEAVKEAREEAERKREENAKKIAAAGTMSIEFQRVDPFGMQTIEINTKPVAEALSLPDPPLVAFLEKHGISTEGMSARTANKMRREIFARKSAGLASFKQINLMARFGLDVKDWYKYQVSALVTHMKEDQKINNRRGWRLPASEIVATIKRTASVREPGEEG